jgi:hypothetical protein
LLEFKLPEEMFISPCSSVSLESLTVDPGTLSPAFHPDSLAYTVELAAGIDSITITATAACTEALLAGDAGEKKALKVEKNTFSIVVTAEDELTFRTYEVTVIRAAAATSVEAATENRWLLLYPNPATGGALTVEDADLKAGDKVEVYSIAGRLVATFEASADVQTVINVSRLPKGAYIVKLGKRIAKVVAN